MLIFKIPRKGIVLLVFSQFMKSLEIVERVYILTLSIKSLLINHEHSRIKT